MTPPRVQHRQRERQVARYAARMLSILGNRERHFREAVALGVAPDAAELPPMSVVDQITAMVRDEMAAVGVDLDDPNAALAILVLTHMTGGIYSASISRGGDLAKAGTLVYNLVMAAGIVAAERHRGDRP